VDVILLIVVIGVSASVAIVIFKAYERTVARVIDVVETNTTAMNLLAEGQREAAKTTKDLDERMVGAVTAIHVLGERLATLSALQGVLSDRQDALTTGQEAVGGQHVAGQV